MKKRLILPALALLIALAATIHAFASPPSPHTRNPRIIFSSAYAPGFDEDITCKGFGGFNIPEHVAFTINGSPIGMLTTDAKGDCLSVLSHPAPFNVDETIEATGQQSGFHVSLFIAHLPYAPYIIVTCYQRHTTLCVHAPSSDLVRVTASFFAKEHITISLGGVPLETVSYDSPEQWFDVTIPPNTPDGAMFTAIGDIGQVSVLDLGLFKVQNHGSNPSPHSPSSPSSH